MKHTLLPLSGMLLFAATLNAAVVTWTGADFNWDQPDTNSFDANYASGDDVIFGNTGVGAVTVGAGVTPGSVTFNHTSGTYTFSGTAYSAGSSALNISGGGTVQFGNMTNTPYTPTWGATNISGGSRLNYTRGSSYVGSSGAQITLNNGTLALGADNSTTYSYNNPISVGAGGGTVIGQFTGNVSIFNLTGNITGSGTLTLQNAGPANNLRGAPGLRISGSDNSGYNGAVLIRSTAVQPGQFGSGMVTFGAAGNLFSNASSITVRDGGTIGFSYAVSAADLGNVVIGPRGGIGATGGSGTLTALSNPMSYVGSGGMLLLDNQNALNNDRLGDTAAIALNNNRLHIIGRNANTSQTNEVAGAMSFSGGSLLSMDRPNSNDSGVKLTVASLASASAGNTLLIQADTWGTTAALNNLIVTGSKPAVTNGMITPGIQHFIGGNSLGNFVTFDGNNVVTATYTSTDITTAGATDLVNIGATAQTLNASKTVHAVRIGQNLNLGGFTLTLGSGGFMTSSVTTSNGTLDFGPGPGFIGVYNAAAQANISATIAGSGGITFMGTSQSANLSASNTFTGGLFINGGTVDLGHANAANANDVTVNAFGRLTTQVTTGTGAIIGGLSGEGRVAARFQGNNTILGRLDISPASGVHEFNGYISDGDQGRILHLTKSGAGTQVFGADSVGVYTGATSVAGGKLIIDGNFAGATGNVTVNASTPGGTAILGGSGIIGGNTTIGADGTLAPGNSAGLLTFVNNLTLGGTVVMEIDGTSRGVSYDAVDVGGLLTYGGDMTVLVGTTFGAGTYAFDLFDFGSATGTYATITIAGEYSGILNSGNSWTYTDGIATWSFTHGTGVLALDVVPEPATYALLGGLAALGLALWRRRAR